MPKQYKKKSTTGRKNNILSKTFKGPLVITPTKDVYGFPKPDPPKCYIKAPKKADLSFDLEKKLANIMNSEKSELISKIEGFFDLKQKSILSTIVNYNVDYKIPNFDKYQNYEAVFHL